MSTITQIENHLECLGYTVLAKDDKINSVMFQKDGSPLLMVGFQDQQIFFYARYEINSIARSDKSGFLSYINLLNSKSILTSYFLTDSDEIGFSGQYFGEYDKRNFSKFVNSWEHDVIDLLHYERATDLYLGDPDQIVSDFTNEAAWS